MSSPRTRQASAPSRALALAGWALLPLRAFLGITFTFAGLEKLANPAFFDANSPSGIYAQLVASVRISPLHGLLSHLLSYSTAVGVLIALAELAVGLGTLLGLWTRVAAAGGALLSLTLFLTVSYHSSPYYTGADIVFFFAWVPLILSGSGGVLSLDAAISSRSAREAGRGSPALVAVRFELIQQVCGHFDAGSCDAQAGAPCATAGCPFLTAPVGPRGTAMPDGVDRRTLVLGAAAVGAVAVGGLVLAGADAAIGRGVGGSSSPGSSVVSLPRTKSPTSPTSTSTTTTAPSAGGTTEPPSSTPAGTAIGSARSVPVGGAATFSDPATGDPAIVLQPDSGTFVAFDTVCPHAGCTVGYSKAADLMVCPCHGSEFNAQTGALVQGPATRGLKKIAVTPGTDGQLYVEG